MNPALRTLEEWTTHQDYFWFLAGLAWAGVIGAEWRRKGELNWVGCLALAQIAGALAELVLLAQDIRVPYTKLDLAMGAAQAAGTAALIWGATAGVGYRAWWRGFVFLLLGGLAAARNTWPLEAGMGLCVVQLIAVLALLREKQRPFSLVAGALLVLAPVVATHGPWAYALGLGRRNTDWSYFALVAAGLVMVGGAIVAWEGWRRCLRESLPDGTRESPLRRDLRVAVFALAGWLIVGLLLAVWYGRQARRAYEENLLRRTEIMVLALDRDMVTAALGPQLRIESIEQRRYPDGAPVDVATVPHTREPVYAALRTRLSELRASNPDLRFLQITTWRQGHLLVAIGSAPRRGEAITHTIRRSVTPQDLEQLAARRSFVEGPIVTPQWGVQFGARAPLLHPRSGLVLGWLNAEIDATRWAVTFTQARLQTMALVGAGVGLWTLAVAYRLRRETRDAAEQKAAAAAAADRMKSAFLAKVSHELRTPIQSVLGYSELLDGIALTETQRSWLTALRSHGDIMLRLVNDLIDLGALQSGAFQLENGPIALRALVEECGLALRPAANAKGLAFHTDIAPGVPGWVRVDGVRLRQILLNLLTNAVKFTPAGGVVFTVRRGEGAWVEFVVADTGAGIPPALRPRLFQPFARLDPAAGDGSGLGLALVQGICSVLGGTVHLAESSGPGATFIVRLPLPRCEPPAGELSDSPLAAPSFAGLRILVAEDNTLVRELLMAFLAENGAEVMVACDGLTALTLARERGPDVLLLDIALPGMDGIRVTEALRREGSRLRIIGLSAHVAAQDEARARAAGMDLFLAKPVRLAQLAAAITAQSRLPGLAEDFSTRIADEKLRARLVAQFAGDTPQVLAEMRAALAATDWPRLRSRAHYLKNSADVLGVSELQEACHRLASLDETPAPGEARQLLDAIETAVPVQFTSVRRVASDRN